MVTNFLKISSNRLAWSNSGFRQGNYPKLVSSMMAKETGVPSVRKTKSLTKSNVGTSSC